MHVNSRKVPLLLLGAIALMCSRAMFFFFDDPEGTNLLTVAMMAILIYLPSLIPYNRTSSFPKKILLAIAVQLLLTFGLYFCLYIQ
jgi:hypothetical protein